MQDWVTKKYFYTAILSNKPFTIKKKKNYMISHEKLGRLKKTAY